MFNEIDLVNHLILETGYSVEIATGVNTENLIGTLVSPLIFVGHVGMKLQDQNSIWSDGYDDVDNPQLLLTEIQIMCPRAELAEVRSNIATAYRKFSPFPADGNYSNLAFIEAKLEEATKYNVFWKEFVGLIFPQTPY